jgi:FkbM family methyltransferase
MLAKHFPEGYVGHAIDVGASDGCSVNTTYGLEKNRCWTVLSVEPNPEFWPVLVAERAWVEKCACGKAIGTATLHINVHLPEAYSTIGPQPVVQSPNGTYSEWRDQEVRVETVDALLAKWQFPKLDLLAVDVEGTERDVMEGTDLERWKPKIVVLESWEAHQHDAYMNERGYKPVVRMIHNNIWIRADAK